MRTLNLSFVLIAMICFFSFQSCKKGDSTPVTPPVVVYPDTLTAGWSKVTVAGETGLFSDIFFNSSTTGYLIGSKIFKSTDGGNTWAAVYSGAGNLINIFMTPDGKAFFTTSNSNTIVKTIDGGANFTSTAIGASTFDIFFIDNNTGFCTAQDGLRTTTDGGITWTKIITSGLPSVFNYSTLSFVNNTTGWITTGDIYRSNGSLANWQQSTSLGSNFESIFATSASTIYAAGGSSIFKSTDGGVNFSFIKYFESPGFTDIHFLDNLNGYVSCGRHVYKTTDGGVNWTTVVSMGQGALGELHFTDATHGWVCGDGVVLIFK